MNVQRVLWSGPDWTDDAVFFVSAQVTEILRRQFGVVVVVARETIVDVLNSQLLYFRPRTGDIFSRYTLDRDDDDVDPLKRAVDVLVAAVSVDIQDDTSNASFSVWNSVNGAPLGMEFHPRAKLNQRRPKQRFNMRF